MNWIFGDNINTDLITPGRFNLTTDPEKLKAAAFREFRPEFAVQVRPGDFIVAGLNFGCGSSRETAALALKSCEIEAILARSFARIFYRNCLNLGLLCIEVDPEGIEPQDNLLIDLRGQELINRSKGTLRKTQVPTLIVRLWKAGGALNFVYKEGLAVWESLFS